MNNKCCIAIITHKDALNGEDERSFIRALSVFGGKRDIKLVIPYDINTSYFDKFNYELMFEYVKVDPSWLSSYKEYNKTLCTSEFYNLFKKYDYVLIYQLDAWVFYDNLDYFTSLNYDYYGAPWPYPDAVNNPVGNGGFSLRKIKKMAEICTKNDYKEGINEDVWFCQVNKDKLNICDIPTAVNFSIEDISPEYFHHLKYLPMGLHGKNARKYNDINEFMRMKKTFYNPPIKNNGKDRCCIVIPTHKEYHSLSDFEKVSLSNTISKMQRYPIVFVLPDGITTEDYIKIGINKFLFFDKKYFKNVESYCELMLSTEFYKLFSNYEYMLISQLDAYIFDDKLEYFLNLNYDYIGSLHDINQGTRIYHPNVGHKLINGNGGFSLRKIDSFIEASKNIKRDLNGKWDWEDVLYSYWYKDKMNIAPDEISLKFGWQQSPEICYKNNNYQLPFGSHKPHVFGKDFEPYKKYFTEI